jgi:acetyl-CoA C-acetyltransferase
VPPPSIIRPVIAGVGQTVDRPAEPALAREPLALMADAVAHALDDAQAAAPSLLAALDTLAVVANVFHDYRDTARLLAERLGCRPRRTLLTTWGGNTPQSLLSHLCDEIAAGRSEVAIVAGAEAARSVRALAKAGLTPPWTPPSVDAAPRWGEARDGTHPLENAHGARQPTVTFALVENAWRASRGQSIEAQRAEIGRFAERCTRVAAENPYAWFPEARTASELVTVTRENRMIAFPYPKRVNAILDVNQGAALVLASEDAARRLGLRRDGLVYPVAGADVHERWFLLERRDYHTLPGLDRAGRALFETVGRDIAAIDHLDLYSCFPIAPRLSAATLGLAPDTARPLTVTGGLPWFGGPGNDYATHAIAAMVERLRAAPGTGLVHALGWNLAKHALAVYATDPPEPGWRRAADWQSWVDTQPAPPLAPQPNGSAVIETYTIVHARDGAPDHGVVIGRLEDGSRFIARLPDDGATLESFEREEAVGRGGTVRTSDAGNVFGPA